MDDVAKVLIVEDQESYRRAARTVVNNTPGFTVAAEAASGEDALDVAVVVGPDLVLMDVHLGGIDGEEATRRLLAIVPSAVVVLMSTYDPSDLPAGVLTSGALRYVDKAEFGAEVLQSSRPASW